MVDNGGRIPQDVIDEIAARLNILDVISQYVPLKRRGANYIGLCPFHNEKTPSFTVSPSKQFYHCFGCGAGGNLFSFIMKLEHLSFPEAVHRLAKEAGVYVPERSQSSTELVKIREKERLFELNELAASFYKRALKATPGKPFLEYLQKRQISGEVIDHFDLGACVSGWDHLSTWLLKKGAKKEELIALGLSSERKNGTLYDRFRDRLMFPIRDEKNRVVGFGGRIIDKDVAPQKYLNSSETPLFHKGNMLYGLNSAKGSIRAKDQVIVVEGYMDVLACYQHGIKNVVAPLGTALTSAQIKKLMRYSYHFLTAFDGDHAGENATLKSIEQIESLGGHIRVISFPDNKDPDEFLHSEGFIGFQKQINDATEGLLFYVKSAIKNNDLTRIEDRMTVLDHVLPILNWQKNPIALDHAFDVIASETGFTREVVRDEWRRGVRRNFAKNRRSTESDVVIQTEKQARLSERERQLFLLLLEKPERIDKIGQFDDIPFEKDAQKTYNYIKEHYRQYGAIRAVDLPDEYARELSQSVQLVTDDNSQTDTFFDRLLLEQRYDSVVGKYNNASSMLSELERSGRLDEIRLLLDELEQLLTLKTTLELQLGKER